MLLGSALPNSTERLESILDEITSTASLSPSW
jgi:hypothetical protein